jgi:hypothetical protein
VDEGNCVFHKTSIGSVSRRVPLKVSYSQLASTNYTFGKGHLGKYCDEFSFRYDARKVSDADRAELLVWGAEEGALGLTRESLPQ